MSSIVSRFDTLFGHPAAAVGSAPGRVNLIGEHIDYHGGTVLPAALPNKINVALAPNADGVLRIHSDRFEGHVERAPDEPASDHWSDAIVGVVAKAHQLGWAFGGFDIYVESTVPGGAGVSSSAALMTAVLRAVLAVSGKEIDATTIAVKSREVENDYIGVPCGIMDQMAVGHAQPGEALALNTGTLEAEVIPIPEDWRFVVMHSGVTRALSDGRYAERFNEGADAAKALGVDELCFADLEAVEKLADPLRKRARHVVTEHQRVLKAMEAMKASDVETFGALMVESHKSYSEDFEASTPVIDKLVETAMTEGAKGARLTGGGFGGCIVALLPADKAEAWTERVLKANPAAWLV